MPIRNEIKCTNPVHTHYHNKGMYINREQTGGQADSGSGCLAWSLKMELNCQAVQRHPNKLNFYYTLQVEHSKMGGFQVPCKSWLAFFPP